MSAFISLAYLIVSLTTSVVSKDFTTKLILLLSCITVNTLRIKVVFKMNNAKDMPWRAWEFYSASNPFDPL
jgi:hypothetical protein